MKVYRVEHGETRDGPFAIIPEDSEAYPTQWGGYLPIQDKFDDKAWLRNAVFGCIHTYNIHAMSHTEVTFLTDWGCVLAVYEVPEKHIFLGTSGRQVMFEPKHACLQHRFDLAKFVIDHKEEEVCIS